MNLENQIADLKSLLSEKKFDETLKKAETLLETNAENPELLKLIGMAWLGKGNNTNGKYFLYKSIRLNRTDVESLGLIATMLLKQEKYLDAEETLEKILAIHPDDFFALRSFGDIKFKAGYQSLALNYYQKACQSQQFSQVSFAHQADVLTKAIASYLNGEHYNKAIEFIDAYPVEGFDENLFLAKRNVYIAKGEEYMPQVLECTRSLHENVPGKVVYIIDLIKFLREANPVEEIKALIGKGLNLNIPEAAKLILLKEAGGFYIESEDWADAINTYEELFELENDIFYLQQLAFARTQTKDFKNALMDVSKAMKLSEEDNLSLLSQRAGLYSKVKLFDKAIADYTKVISLSPEANNADAYYSLGLIYHKIEDTQNSVKMLLKADMDGHLKANEYLLKKFPKQLIKIRAKNTDKFKAKFEGEKARNLKSPILSKAFEAVWSSDIKKNIKSFEEQIPFLKVDFLKNYLDQLSAEVLIITPEALLYNNGDKDPLEAFYSVEMESEHAIILNIQPIKGGQPSQMKLVVNEDNLILHYPLTDLEIPPKYFLSKDKANEHQLQFFKNKPLDIPYHESVEKKVQVFTN
ncbi:MAG: Unknown protein [uncultured Aureispira sp.]|uniref:Tetratricopeptide repeat protein n=1 Tax=uncultured Aureispira sp. TaxID=1331704 RepID=A0A6S6TEQ7_9BACT|nr:MAG: Unknown protein [uncultured Aureispira sp.]